MQMSVVAKRESFKHERQRGVSKNRARPGKVKFKSPVHIQLKKKVAWVGDLPNQFRSSRGKLLQDTFQVTVGMSRRT